MDQEYYNQIANDLKEKSKDICTDNECTEEEHNCESYAYFTKDDDNKNYTLQDVCASDYAQSYKWIPVPLPFEGTGEELLEAIQDADTLDI